MENLDEIVESSEIEITLKHGVVLKLIPVPKGNTLAVKGKTITVNIDDDELLEGVLHEIQELDKVKIKPSLYMTEVINCIGRANSKTMRWLELLIADAKELDPYYLRGSRINVFVGRKALVQEGEDFIVMFISEEDADSFKATLGTMEIERLTNIECVEKAFVAAATKKQ